MNKIIHARLCDSKQDSSKRRYRNILVASGDILESGEIRDIQNLYVMGHDAKLYRISDLSKDPDRQTEDYSLKAQADHGELKDGELVPTVEKVFGDCRVWLEEDGIHARMYFADNDQLADHCFAISDNASYSAGADWYEDGYYGSGLEIDEPMGILREISMVTTGNDPRARTIDTKLSKGSDGAAVGDNNKIKKGNKMNGIKKSIDALTPDERAAMQHEMGEAVNSIIDKFTTDAPESETEPTAKPQDSTDSADTNTEAAPTKPSESNPTSGTKDNVLHMPILTFKDRAPVHQEQAVPTKDWRFSPEARRKFADMAYRHGGFKGAFMADWMKELRSHGASTNDGITGLGLPVDTRQLIINAIEKSDGIISHFRQLGGKSYLIKLITAVGADTDAETARAHGFKKGDKKIFQELLSTPRNIYNKMVYKMLDLDSMELYENPELSRIRAEELVQALIIEMERAAVIGDGRSAPTGNAADYRMFDGTRGFWSMAADAAATEGFGQLLATAITAPAGSNLYDASILAESAIDTEGGLIYVMKKSVLTTFRQARLSGDDGRYLVEPGMRIEDIINAERVYTPKWMDNADVDVVVFANNTYGLTGEANPTMRPEFKTETNQDVLLAEQPRGGSLIAYKAAATIKFATAPASTASTK